MTVERMSAEQLERWRADPGSTAITIEILPHDAVTVAMTDRDLDEALRGFETTLKITEADRTDFGKYASLRREMADRLVPALARYDRRAIFPCAIAAIWCVLNHPNDRGALRLKMDALRAQGLAPHFTLCRGPGKTATYGTVIGYRYADIRKDVQQRVGEHATILSARDY